MPAKIRLALIFGGQSAEHAVSLESGKNVAEALDPAKYETHLIGIDRNGVWRYLNDAALLRQTDVARPINLEEVGTEVFIVPTAKDQRQAGQAAILDIKTQKVYGYVDAAFPILHGPYGEDGTMQGYLRLLGLPYVGCGVLGSAVGMDKDVAKRLLRDAGLPIAKFVVFKRHQCHAGTYKNDFARLRAELGVPFFIKPVNMGSSVGVHKINGEDSFARLMDDAFQYDTKVMAEEFLTSREIECSVLGNEITKASTPGEILPQHEFYSYEAKYLDDNGALLKIPAELSPAQATEVKTLALKVFDVLCGEGLARVDFFMRKADGKFFVNEVNTIPGFTKISMYPKMWNRDGLGYSPLIDRLVELAMERAKTEKSLKR